MGKRWLGAVLAFCLLAGCLWGCDSLGGTSKPESSSKPVTTAQPEKSVNTPKSTVQPSAKNTNLLTGLPTLSEEAIGKRPVAVMVNNIFESLPQYGISDADVIFEIPVEYDITRLMALYGDYTKVPQVCSVRSCRYYYPILAAGYDAYYVHWGQDETIATEVLWSLDIDTMDGMEDTYGLFYRDEEREGEGFAYEHTGYFDGPSLPTALAENQVRTELEVHKTEPFFNFKDAEQSSERKPCTQMQVNFSSKYYSTFRYNEKSKLYYKEHSGTDHRDSRTGKQLAFTNVLVLETDIEIRDDVGRRDVNWRGGEGYKGYYISEGEVENISWSKEDEYGNLEFFASDGKPLGIRPGKTYIAFTYPDTTDLNLS